MTKKRKEEFIKETKSWTPEQWEEYLQKRVDKPMSESALPQNFDEETSKGFNHCQGEEKPQDEKRRLELMFKSAFNKLTQRQKTILQLLFYERLTQRQIATKLNISRRCVRIIKDQGLQKLKRFLLPKLLPLSPFIGGGVMEQLILHFPSSPSFLKNNHLKKLG